MTPTEQAFDAIERQQHAEQQRADAEHTATMRATALQLQALIDLKEALRLMEQRAE